MRNSRVLKIVVLVAIMVVLAVAAPSLAERVSAAGAKHSSSAVYVFDPFPTPGAAVPGASARLVTNASGATMQLSTSGLTPGDAVTTWWLIFNNPENCAGYPTSPCTLDDLFGNTQAVGGEATLATGHVIGGDGRGNFAAHLAPGPVRMGWFGNGYTNVTGAEIHIVVHTHGQAIPGLVDEMISSFRAGCADDAMINPSFPANAYNDGTPGPNQCQDLQAAVFQQ